MANAVESTGNAGQKRRSAFTRVFPNERVRVLRTRIQLHQLEVDALASAHKQPNGLTVAQTYLRRAQECLDAKDFENSWSLLYRAREELIEVYDIPQLGAMARALCAEVQEDKNLARWRVRVVLELLKQDVATGSTSSDAGSTADRRQRLRQAAKIRDDGQAEVFVRLAVHRHFQWILLVFGFPILTGTIWLTAANADQFGDPSWRANSAIPCWLAVMYGIVGALVSAAQRSSKIDTVTIADYMQLLAATCSRIPIGAVAGLTVWLFSVAAVGDGAAGLNIPNMLLAAFGAGFAERLVVQGSRANSDEGNS